MGKYFFVINKTKMGVKKFSILCITECLDRILESNFGLLLLKFVKLYYYTI